MSTVHKNKAGQVVKTEPGTKYHPEGTGPRNADGSRIVDAAIESNPEAETAPAAASDARPATAKKDPNK